MKGRITQFMKEITLFGIIATFSPFPIAACLVK
jgi:hypothetical protein